MAKKDENFKTSYKEIPKRLNQKIRRTPEHILPYDKDNLYPQRVRLFIESSPTASASAKVYVRHIHGDGFKDMTLSGLMINDDQTADELLEKIAEDMPIGGFAVHIRYNGMLQKTAIEPVKFENVRQWDDRTEDHKYQYAIYDDWERVIKQRIQKDDIVWIDRYTEDEDEIAAQIEQAGGFENWKGHLFYYPGEYPLSPMDSSILDMETDSELQAFRNSTVMTSFMASYALFYEGDLSEDEANELDRLMLRLQGARNAGKVIRMEGLGDNDRVRLEKLDEINHDGLFEITESQTQKNIRKSLMVPRELAGEEFQSGFSTDQVDQMRDYYSSITRFEREKISRQFKKIMTNFEVPLTGDFEIIPLYKKSADPNI